MITNVKGYQNKKKISQIRVKHVLKKNGDETFEKYMIYQDIESDIEFEFTLFE